MMRSSSPAPSIVAVAIFQVSLSVLILALVAVGIWISYRSNQGIPPAETLTLLVTLVGSALLGMVAAIGLLRLKNWARLLSLCLVTAAVCGDATALILHEIGNNDFTPPEFLKSLLWGFLLWALIPLAVWWWITLGHPFDRSPSSQSSMSLAPRKRPRWRIAAISLPLLGWLGLGYAGVQRFIDARLAGPPDKDPDNASYNLDKTVIQTGMRDMDKAFLAPDGSRVLIDRRDWKPDLPATRWLEVHDVASFRNLATIPLPPIPPAPLGNPKVKSVSKAVHFCDGGKSILVYESGYTFSIIDARTYTQKASITLPSPVHRPEENPIFVDSPQVNFASSCAANAPVAGFELMFGPFGTGVTQVFNLDTGKQISEFTADTFGYLRDFDVSPSGASAAILVTRFVPGYGTPVAYDSAKYNFDLAILDLKTRSVRTRILSDMRDSRVAFAGDDEIAVAGDGREKKDELRETSTHAREKLRVESSIELFDIHTGAVSQRFGDQTDGARAFVAASADGRILLGYTGKEWLYKEEGQGYLQIDRARFTIWDRQTGKAMAQSPGLQVFKTAYRMLDWSHSISYRPTLDYSQQGNAVLVSWPGETKRLEVFTIK
jgi:hypothetical protein